MARITFVRVQLSGIGVNQMLCRYSFLNRRSYWNWEMKFFFNSNSATTSSWNDRVLIAAVVVTMVLSLLGYMHA
jgi:hypothetical protein